MFVNMKICIKILVHGVVVTNVIQQRNLLYRKLDLLFSDVSNNFTFDREFPLSVESRIYDVVGIRRTIYS